MAWTKSPEALQSTFAAALPDDARAERRPMFGYPACFVNGNMFAGLWQDCMVVRLGETDRKKLLGIAGAKVFEPMAGRPMKEYVIVPKSVLDDTKSLRKWTSKAFEFGASLPAKVKKAKATATKPKKKKKS